MAPRTVPIALTDKHNPARYTQGGSASIVNGYAEVIGDEGKTQYAIVASDGLQGWLHLEGVSGPIRALLEVDGLLYIVAGTSARLFRAKANGFVLDLGALSGFDQSGPVYMARNRRSPPDVAIVNNGMMFYYRTSLAQVSDVDLLAPTSLAVVDGIFLIGTANNKWQAGEIDDASAWDALSFERADASPDAVVRVYGRQGEALIFGETTTEFWGNAGLADGTGFSRTEVAEFGCLAPGSVVTVGGLVYFVAHDRTVRRTAGYTPERISTHAIEREIEALPDKTVVVGYTWVRDGHSFYVIRAGSLTFAYDTVTGLWHRRRSYGDTAWNVGCAAVLGGKTIVGSITGPDLYEMGPQFLDDAGQPLVLETVLPPLVLPGKKITVHRAWWDWERGVGTGQGDDADVDPEVMIQWSLDGGATFSGNRTVKLGAQGRRTNDLEIRRLGQCKGQGFVFKLTCSAKVAKAIYQGQAEITVDG